MLFNLIFTTSYQGSLIHPFPEALAPSSMLAECLAASHGECGSLCRTPILTYVTISSGTPSWTCMITCH